MWLQDAAVARKAAVTIYGELALGTGRAFMKMMGEDGTKQVRDLMMANLSPPQPIEVCTAAALWPPLRSARCRCERQR